MAERFFDLAATDEIPLGTGKAFSVGELSIAVFNCDGNYFAINDMCPHMAASLASGHLEKCVVACPWHAWRFDVRDGTWMDNPRIKTDTYEIRIRDSRIEVKVPMNSDSLTTNEPAKPALSLGDFQALIRKMYFEKDVARGVEGTFMWLMEEVGELSTALRERDHQALLGEFADVLAWLCTIANVCEIDLSHAIQLKYGSGCPGCHKLVCSCPDSEKP